MTRDPGPAESRCSIRRTTARTPPAFRAGRSRRGPRGRRGTEEAKTSRSVDPTVRAYRRGQVPARGGHRRNGAPGVGGGIVRFHRVELGRAFVEPPHGVQPTIAAERRRQASARGRHGGHGAPAEGRRMVDLYPVEERARGADAPERVDAAVGTGCASQIEAGRRHGTDRRPATRRRIEKLGGGEDGASEGVRPAEGVDVAVSVRRGGQSVSCGGHGGSGIPLPGGCIKDLHDVEAVGTDGVVAASNRVEGAVRAGRGGKKKAWGGHRWSGEPTVRPGRSRVQGQDSRAQHHLHRHAYRVDELLHVHSDSLPA